jgi:signal transduction histidine kinase
MFKKIFRNAVRQLKGRPFHDRNLEREFVNVSREPRVRLAYIFCWVAAAAFAVFSVAEFFFYGRPATDQVQIIRAGLILFFCFLGWYLKASPKLLARHYTNISSSIIVFIALAAFLLEFKSQVAGQPSFFYLSITSIAILLTLIVTGFLQLSVRRTFTLTIFCALACVVTATESMEPNAKLVGRMFTYLVTANLIGFVLHRLIEIRERRLLLQTMRLRKVAELRKKLIEAETAANETKTRFLAMLSHEIRTPMNGILGLVGMLQQDMEMTDSRAKAFDALSFSCDRLLRTFNDLLDYAKLGHSDAITMLKPSFFELEPMLQEACKVVTYAAQQKHIDLQTDFSQVERLTLLGDHAKLSRVIINLVSNAVKFTSEGWVRVTASSQRASNDMARISIVVADTGIGIPKEHLAKVFQAFYQVDSSHSRKYEGSGLGLAICKQIVTAMSGKISVDSELGQGTRFTIELKLPIAHAAHAIHAAQSAPAPAASESPSDAS